MKTFYPFIVVFLLFIVVAVNAADKKEVMPARKRAEIVATAKALFEPQVKNSIKVGRVNSPFSAAQ